MTTTQKPREGDRVKVIPPHGEAGAIGEVQKVYAENDNYRARARVLFIPEYGDNWIKGTMTVDLEMLEVVR